MRRGVACSTTRMSAPPTLTKRSRHVQRPQRHTCPRPSSGTSQGVLHMVPVSAAPSPPPPLPTAAPASFEAAYAITAAASAACQSLLLALPPRFLRCKTSRRACPHACPYAWCHYACPYACLHVPNSALACRLLCRCGVLRCKTSRDSLSHSRPHPARAEQATSKTSKRGHDRACTFHCPPKQTRAVCRKIGQQKWPANHPQTTL